MTVRGCSRGTHPLPRTLLPLDDDDKYLTGVDG